MLKNDPASWLERQNKNFREIATDVVNEAIDTRINPRFDKLESEIAATKAASETAHKEIIARLDAISAQLANHTERLDRLEERG